MSEQTLKAIFSKVRPRLNSPTFDRLKPVLLAEGTFHYVLWIKLNSRLCLCEINYLQDHSCFWFSSGNDLASYVNDDRSERLLPIEDFLILHDLGNFCASLKGQSISGSAIESLLKEAPEGEPSFYDLVKDRAVEGSLHTGQDYVQFALWLKR